MENSHEIKVKQLRQNYGKAIGSGRKSGGGRLVATCGDIWGGSPATVAMPHGIESGETNTMEDESIGDVNDDVYLQELAGGDIPSSSNMEPSRSKKMTTFLKERRNKVSQKKIPVAQQLLTIVREEINLKKEMMEHMKKQEEDFNQNIRSMQMLTLFSEW